MNRNLSPLVIHCLALFLMLSCAEDTIDFVPKGSISGTVIQANTSEPLEGVEMTTVPATSIVLTDSTGAFHFEQIAANDYKLRARLDNYQIETVSISVVGDSETQSTLFLLPEKGLLQSAKSPIPSDGSSDLGTEVQLNWTNTNESTVEVTYTVKVFEANATDTFQSFENIEDTLVVLQNLKFNTQYFWQVSTINNQDEIEYSEMWRFTTSSFVDNRILFTAETDEGFTQIFSIDESGEEVIQLTYSTHNKFSPLYNSDRSAIAYIGNDGIEQHIYTMSNTGENLKKVTSVTLASYHQQGRGFAWSPDDSKFIYCHYDKLYSIGVDGSNLTEIATAPTDRHFRSCDWSEANNLIIAETVGVSIYDGEIIIMDADGTNQSELVADVAGIMENPSFAIDGLSFMYTRDISGSESLNGRQLNSHLFYAPIADPTNTVDLSDQKANGNNDLFPKPSSDGSKIIFVNRKNDGSNVGNVLTVDIDDPSTRTVLVKDAHFPSWR
ncbi:TolB protein [Reichenbachiella faecimaris]|uniref:TolB protein n=1 Tax=Reichenbachiella faecimaris TaxID=692418 RepID=A0A1W2GJK3_REIFA|nr:carboxypeptidase-like regulatory domain-containing protein [Reichenbachiella faecimaris]SMD36839.1 TolB protein [Reichenbachiella faecimaris]